MGVILASRTDHRSQVCTALTARALLVPDVDAWAFGVEAGRVVEILPAPQG